MDNELVEAMARAMAVAEDDDPDRWWQDYTRSARAAITVIEAATPLASLKAENEALREDAERWRAFASSRFKFAGSAGFDHSEYPKVSIADDGGLHLGLEIWPSDGSDQENEQYVHGRNLLMAYVEDRRATLTKQGG